VEVGNTAAIYEMVKMGQGVALLPDWLIKQEVPSPVVVARPVSGIRLLRTWAYVEPTWKIPNLAGRTFKRLCQQATVTPEFAQNRGYLNGLAHPPPNPGTGKSSAARLAGTSEPMPH
jgi:hypothetical protein